LIAVFLIRKKHLLITVSIGILVVVSIPLGAQIFEQIPDNPLQGRVVFEKKYCYKCHTIGREGVRDLSKVDIKDGFFGLVAKIWNHIPKMDIEFAKLRLKWQDFTAEELVDLTSFLYFIEYLGNPGNADRGKRLIASKGCLSCHQIKGMGNKGGHSLDKMKCFTVPLHIITAIWNHAPQMIERLKKKGLKLPKLQGRDIEDMTAYLKNIYKDANCEVVYISPGNPHIGKELFAEKGCMKCHSVGGKGGIKGLEIEKIDLKKSVSEIGSMMWNHADIMLKNIKKRKVKWPVFSEQEMADLFSYLYFIKFQGSPGNARIGKRLFKTKGCIECHSVGGKKGIDLTKAKFLSETDMIASLLNHAPQMKDVVIEKDVDWPTFSGEDLKHIFAYLESVKKKDEEE
jgi:cytochrome c551/c552/pterin-4a-carbinolamine dehydratase